MRKVVLTLPVYYDDEKTNGPELASALDQLLATAMSTPGVLDDHGSPPKQVEVGEFEIVLDTRWPVKPDDVQHIIGLREMDGPLLARQREWVMALGEGSELPNTSVTDMQRCLQGLTNFLDVVADQLHDKYGIPCLLEDPDDVDESSIDDNG